MKILITGALGFIGHHLAKKLLKEGHVVYGIDDLSGGSMDNMLKASYYVYDCRDQLVMNRVIKKIKPDIIFHLAAQAAENKSQFSPIDVTTRNYNAFLNVLVAGINNGMKRFIYVSSNAVYGAIKPPFKESDTPNPEDLYGLSKLHCEKTLEILSKVHKFEYVIARPHNVYGPMQCMNDPYRNVMTIWMNKLMKGEPYVIYGDGSMKRCYTYVDDLIDGLYKLGFESVHGEIFNLGSDEACSLKELSDTLLEVTKSTLTPTHLPTRPQEVEDATPNHDKAKAVLGFKAKTSLKEGLKKTWEWAKKQGPQPFVYTPFEINSEKIPENWKV